MGIETVLVVDDNRSNQALARATLEDEGYRILVADDGEQAIAAVERERPSCVLMDIRMPRVDGYTACERIRAMPGSDEIAIIFVTAQHDVEAFDRAVAAGGDDFITKPFRTDELVLRVRTAMRIRKIATDRTELVDELKQQRERLQRLELQKEQLIAFLVHDLKNPVHAIALHVRSIQRNATDVERSLRSAASIEDETRTLLRMITNLLDISKADEGRLEPAICQLETDALVEAVVDELRPRAVAAGVQIATEVEAPVLEADPDLISRVVANLVDNAIRYAPEGTKVRISVVPVHEGVELSIADSGPGVPEPMRRTAFERFERGNDRAGRTNRGLGLAFCKIVVEAHHGRIWIDDASPGAVFRVQLPARG